MKLFIRNKQTEVIRVLFSLLFCFCAFTTAQADTLQTSREKLEGSFEGYEKGNFMFRLASGKSLKKPRISVRKMTITNPREATITRSSRGKQETHTLTGYERGKFLIIKDDKPTGITAMHVSRISISVFSKPATAGSGKKAKSKIDLSRLDDKQLSPAQTSIVSSYKKALNRYRDFRAESSAMVKEMDTATGSRREHLLNELRVRKNTEQPIKNAYKTSRAALVKEFPELLAPKTEAPQEEGATEVTTGTEIVLTIPKLDENQVLFIDTSILTKAGAVSDTQSSAMKRYNDAKTDYQTKINLADSDRDALTSDLKSAQAELFKAFPNLKVVEE